MQLGRLGLAFLAGCGEATYYPRDVAPVIGTGPWLACSPQLPAASGSLSFENAREDLITVGFMDAACVEHPMADLASGRRFEVPDAGEATVWAVRDAATGWLLLAYTFDGTDDDVVIE